DALRFHLSYGGGMGASSCEIHYQAFGTGAIGDGFAGIISCNTGVAGVPNYLDWDLPAQVGRTSVSVLAGRFGTMSGPFFSDMVAVERPNKTDGFIHQPFVGYGGHGLAAMYADAMDGGSGIGNPSAEALLANLMKYANGANTKFIVFINSGLND